MNFLLTAAVVVILLLLAFIAGVMLAFVLKLRQLEDNLSQKYQDVIDFVTPAGEDKPSQLATVLDAWSVSLARAIVSQVKTSLMGMESGLKRGEKAVQGDVAVDTAGMQLPGILENMPALRKSLRRNPGLIDLALPFLANFAGKQGNAGVGAGSGNNGHKQVKFNL